MIKTYQHRGWSGGVLPLPVGKVVCVGSNYHAHIAEMGGKAAAEPVLFIKPGTALCHLEQPLQLPDCWGQVHHEIELAILIGQPLKQVDEATVQQAIAGYAIALDLTLRDLQSECKKQGRPWEKAKGFDGACPVSGFVEAALIKQPQEMEIILSVNGQVRQQANTSKMITAILPLISYMSQFFTLLPGDIILTGTPEGVGPLVSGDQLQLSFADWQQHSYVL